MTYRLAKLALHSVIGCAVLLLVQLLHGSSVFAAPPNTLPENSNLYYTVSAGSTGGAGTNRLYSPQMWLKVYAGTNDGTTIRFINGNQCPNISGYDSGTRKTRFELHSVDSNENYFFYNGVTETSVVKSVSSSDPNACGDVVMNIPAGSLTESDVPGHVSPFGTKLFVGLIKIYMDPQSETVNGPLNVFRVTASGAYLGVWAKTITDAKESTEPSRKNSTTLLGRPNTGSNTPTDTYNLKFKPPCTYFGGGLSPQPVNVYLKWQDDDAGTSYQPPFTMRLIEYDDQTGAVTNNTVINTRSGEGEYASAEITIRPSRKYVWQWSGITRRNGVQVFYPFDSGDFDLKCPVFADAACAIQNEGDVPRQVRVNEEFSVRLVVGNSGSIPWDTRYKLGSGAENPSGTDPKNHDNNFWQASSNGNNTVNAAGNRIDLTNYPVPGSSGSTDPSLVLPALRIVQFKARAPATSGTYPFWWQIVQEGAAWRGEPCKRTIEVVQPENRPFITVGGGDVYSGATFKNDIDGTCTVSNVAKSADINTNGYYQESAPDLRGSSNAQYAVTASGRIGSGISGLNTFRANYGYANRFSDTGDGLRDGLFASYGVGSEYGNFYRGLDPPPLPCVDLSEYETNAVSLGTPEDVTSFLQSSENGVRSFTGPITISNISDLSGKKVLIVNGDVTIQGSITHPLSYSLDAIPSLEIVAVQGNIYIEAAAGVIDASLIALPVTSNPSNNSEGILDTCSTNGAPGSWPREMTVGSCNSNLTIHGTVAARRILWKRTWGTLGIPGDLVDTTCFFGNYGDPNFNGADAAAARYKLCGAEVIDYGPESYLSDLGGDANSIPITTQELPPIY